MKEKNWTELVRPQHFEVRPAGDAAATVVVEPLERGFGFTLGAALRRIMLASIPGWSVVAVRIAGAAPENGGIAGVREGLDEVLLNLKELAIRGEGDGPRRLVVSAAAGGVVTAADIAAADGVAIVDPGQVICTAETGDGFHAELIVAPGMGYRPARLHPADAVPEGFSAIDSLYSPVRRVSYAVEPTRRGQILDYDRLVIEIGTNGTVTAEEALTFAARIMHDQLGAFHDFEDEPVQPAAPAPDPLGFSPVLLKRVDELELSVRASNCMRHENVVYIGDLVTRTEAELLRVPNFGRKSLNEIKASLAGLGLTLGVAVPDWPPVDVENLARQFAED